MAELHTLTLPGPMLQRGFWLYVWRIDTLRGERLYVGRTGDNSSPYATAPYTRMGQHLGFIKASNSLRRLLTEQGIEPEQCAQFDLVSYGPIFPEIGKTEEQEHGEQMELHKPVRDRMAALERDLRNALADAGYDVLNLVRSKAQPDPDTWRDVLAAFSANFPKLKGGTVNE
ncbi:hypothetical protein [Agrobacterium tumefaciens]|uniref:hypothetical protein n=1 Tax=Agrobacterium tumefaciens TaxID=358 RepID=UPI003BA1CE55